MNPSAAPENPPFDERVASAVARHQRRLRLLTGVAWGLGLLAALASVILIFLYFTAYMPKEKQLLADMGIAAGFPHVRPAPDLAGSGLTAVDVLGIQISMTRAVSMGTMFIACAVGSLALGTLVVLVVALRTSRATMSQVQMHLAQISGQLQSLRSPPTS